MAEANNFDDDNDDDDEEEDIALSSAWKGRLKITAFDMHSHRVPLPILYDEVKLLDSKPIIDHLLCPICLEIITETRTVMNCLHRFCKSCIIDSLRLGKKECPTCRIPVLSKRDLRTDEMFDGIISIICGDIEKMKKNQSEWVEQSISSRFGCKFDEGQKRKKKPDHLGDCSPTKVTKPRSTRLKNSPISVPIPIAVRTPISKRIAKNVSDDIKDNDDHLSFFSDEEETDDDEDYSEEQARERDRKGGPKDEISRSRSLPSSTKLEGKPGPRKIKIAVRSVILKKNEHKSAKPIKSTTSLREALSKAGLQTKEGQKSEDSGSESHSDSDSHSDSHSDSEEAYKACVSAFFQTVGERKESQDGEFAVRLVPLPTESLKPIKYANVITSVNVTADILANYIKEQLINQNEFPSGCGYFGIRRRTIELFKAIQSKPTKKDSRSKIKFDRVSPQKIIFEFLKEHAVDETNPMDGLPVLFYKWKSLKQANF